MIYYLELVKQNLAKDIANMTIYKLANAVLPSRELYGTENDYSDADSLISSDTAMYLSNMFPELFYNEEILNAAWVELEKKRDRASSSMEKDANRRINRITNRLCLSDEEGIFAHSFGKVFTSMLGSLKILNPRIINMFNNYMQPTGKARAVAPSAIISQSKPINIEQKDFTRKNIQTNSKWLPVGSTVDDMGKVTTPFLKQKPIGSIASTTTGIESEGDIIGLLQSKTYDKYLHDRLPFVSNNVKTPWTISLEALPFGRYGRFGIVVPDHCIKGRVKVDRNQARKGLRNAEYRLTPEINSNGTLTTGTVEGFPFYLVGNKVPSEEERAVIKALKKIFPTILPIKEKDFEFINKRLPQDDVRQFWLKNIKGKPFDKVNAKRIVDNLEKSEATEIKDTELFKALIRLL